MIITLDPKAVIKEKKAQGPILSPQIYFGKSTNFHPKGLYSEEIFGVEGSPERRGAVSWIDLNCNIIHPVLYSILKKRIFRKMDDVLHGDRVHKFFSIDENGYLVEDPNGEISGLTALEKNIKKIRFQEGEDEEGDRNKIIEMIYKNIESNKFFMNKLLVIPPDYRPIHVIHETNETRIDELTKLYQKIIGAASQLGSVSGSIYDVLAFRMQNLINELYELIKLKTSKKSGMIRHLMLGKTVDFSARSVITPEPELDVGYIGLPLRTVCTVFEPSMLYGLMNSPKSKKFVTKEFNKAVKEFLDKEEHMS